MCKPPLSPLLHLKKTHISSFSYSNTKHTSCTEPTFRGPSCVLAEHQCPGRTPPLIHIHIPLVVQIPTQPPVSPAFLCRSPTPPQPQPPGGGGWSGRAAYSVLTGVSLSHRLRREHEGPLALHAPLAPRPVHPAASSSHRRAPSVCPSDGQRRTHAQTGMFLG